MNKTPESILTVASLAAGAETTLATAGCDFANLTRAISMVLAVEVTYGASATDGLTISVWPLIEADNDTADSTAWATWDVPLTAGETILLHWPLEEEILPLPAYVKAVVKNDSGAGADTTATSITIRAIVLEL